MQNTQRRETNNMLKNRRIANAYVENEGLDNEIIYLDVDADFGVEHSLALIELLVKDLMMLGISVQDIVDYIENTTESDLLA